MHRSMRCLRKKSFRDVIEKKTCWVIRLFQDITANKISVWINIYTVLNIYSAYFSDRRCLKYL